VVPHAAARHNEGRPAFPSCFGVRLGLLVDIPLVPRNHQYKGNDMTKTATVHAQQKWEYMELARKTDTFLLNDLNEVGQDGWELVTIAHGKDRQGEITWTAVLKRPYVATSH
jgi:hypothetical protein